jgi:hypothetical protein
MLVLEMATVEVAAAEMVSFTFNLKRKKMCCVSAR